MKATRGKLVACVMYTVSSNSVVFSIVQVVTPNSLTVVSY